MDVAQWMQLSLKDTLGQKSHNVVLGVGEAVERTAKDSFDWLRVLPFLQKHDELTLQIPQKHWHEMESEFLMTAGPLLVQAEEYTARGMYEKSMEADDLFPSLSGTRQQESVFLEVSRSWLRELVLYAPSLDQINSLCSGGLKDRMWEVAPAFQRWKALSFRPKSNLNSSRIFYATAQVCAQ